MDTKFISKKGGKYDNKKWQWNKYIPYVICEVINSFKNRKLMNKRSHVWEVQFVKLLEQN